MRTPSQPAIRTCEPHWLFSDELATEETLLPPFVPRVLNYEASNSLLDQSPRFQEALAPPGPNSNPALLLPPLFYDVVSSRIHKRRNHSDAEESYHRRKCARSSNSDLTRNWVSENFEPSPILTATTISPVFHLHAPQVQPDHSNYWQKLELETIKAQNEMLTTKTNEQSSELLESKRCIAFLTGEIRRMVTSIQNLKELHNLPRTIDDAGHRLEAFIQTSTLMTQMDAPQETTGSYSKVQEDIGALNLLTSNIGWSAPQVAVPLAPFEGTLCCPSFSCYHNCNLNTSSESFERYSATEMLEGEASSEASFQSSSTCDNLPSDDHSPDHPHHPTCVRSDQLGLHLPQSLVPVPHGEHLGLSQNYNFLKNSQL